MPSPHPGISLPARDACAQGALSRPTDRFAPSHGAHGPLPCPCSPGLPQIPVKLIVLLIDRALIARGLAEEPHGKLRVACVEFPAWCQHCLLSECHTRPSRAAPPAPAAAQAAHGKRLAGGNEARADLHLLGCTTTDLHRRFPLPRGASLHGSSSLCSFGRRG